MILFDLASMASRTVSEINGDFRRKSPIFPTLCILRPAEGYRRKGSKDYSDGAIGRSKKF